MIQREAFRCQKITQNLLEFARGNGDRCACHDLTSIVNDVLRVVRIMSRYRDRTIRFTRTAPCLLEMNGPEIQQVVLNLVSNGLEAMDDAGTMTITITEQTDHVTLIITDDGCGMTQQVIDNLFEPFFTHGATAAARAWACRSRTGSSPITAAQFRWKAPAPATAAPSACGSPAKPSRAARPPDLGPEFRPQTRGGKRCHVWGNVLSSGSTTGGHRTDSADYAPRRGRLELCSRQQVTRPVRRR